MKILITDISSPKAVAIAKFISLNYPGADVISCDTRKSSGYIHTRYTGRHYVLKAGLADKEAYLRAVLELVAAEGVDLCLPVNNGEMKVLMEHRDELPRAFGYLGARQSFESLDDKANLNSIAKALGIPAPAGYRTLEEAVLPFVLKPANLSSSKGVSYVFTAAQKSARERAGLAPGFICQEYILGFGAGYSVFCAGGEIMCGFGHKRLLEYPAEGGTSVYRENYANEGMVDAARKMLRETGWSGFVMFEFKIDVEGKAFLIEANPRIWGSINQGLANGTNYFEALLGKSAPPAEIPPGGVRTYYSPLVYFSLLGCALRLEFGRVTSFFSGMSGNRCDASFFDDPLGWLSFLNLAYEKN